MNVKQMIKLSRENAKNRNHEQRMEFLQRARILDSNGFYREDLFSPETVLASKRAMTETKLQNKSVL